MRVWWHILGMRTGELAVWISQLANMWGIFCWPVDIYSVTEYSQLNKIMLHSRMNSVDYKNAFRSRLTHTCMGKCYHMT